MSSLRLLSKRPLGDRQLIAVLVALTVLRGLVWISLLPVFKIADEPSHFMNAQYRAEYGRAPFYANDTPIDKVINPGAPAEVTLAWRTTLRLWRDGFLANTRVAPEEQILRAFGRDANQRRGDGQMTSIPYPGVYYNLGAAVYFPFKRASVLVRVFALRCLSLAFGVLAVICTFLVGRLLFASRALAFAAALLVCLQPMESQMTIAVNNDAAVIGFSALLFYLQVRVLARLPEVPSWHWGALFGVVAALDVQSKPQAYALLPGCALVCALVVYRNLRQRRAWLFSTSALMAFALPILSTLSQVVKTGGTSVLPGGGAAGPVSRAPATFLAFIDSIDANYKGYLFKSSFGQFGWVEYGINWDMVEAIHLIEPVALWGLVAACSAYVIFGKSVSWISMRVLLFSLATALFGVTMILYAEYRFRMTGIVGVIQGRNFLYVLPAAAVTVTAAFAALMPARFRTLSAASLVTAAFALHLYSIVLIARYHYGS